MQNAARPGSDATTWTLRVNSMHPAVHGPMTIQLRVSGQAEDGIIAWAEPAVIPMHRGVEKLFESRDYRQALMLADRHDWHSAFGSELGLALTIEALTGLAVPKRATWIRTAMAELNRAVHHLRWLGETVGELASDGPADDPSLSLRDQCRSAREVLTWFHEANSGGKLHPMLVVPGGVRVDVPDGWARGLRETVAGLGPLAESLTQWVEARVGLAGIGVLPLDVATAFGVTGPVARASGLALDLRFDDPYLNYEELAAAGILTRNVFTAGDVRARLGLLAAEFEVTLKIIEEATARLESTELQGPVNVRLPRSLRIPEGTGYGWTENPTGINGWFIESRGGPMPYRLKLRTASFANAQALGQLLVGQEVRNLPTILMSFLLVAGDLAK